MIRTTGSRWFSAGASVHRDSLHAGVEATEQAFSAPDPKIAIVFCSDRHDTAAVLAGVNRVASGIPVVGVTTAGEIANGTVTDGSVVVTAIGGSGLDVVARLATDIRGRPREAGIELASCVDPLAAWEHRVMVVLPDGLATGHRDLLRGAYSRLGAAVPMVGGCAADSLRLWRTQQFYGGEVFTDAAVGIGIGSSAPFGIGVCHGWHQVGEFLTITKMVGYAVTSINDEPALDLYLRSLDAPKGAYEDQEAFLNFAIRHPLGLSHSSGGQEMRFIARADFDERALVLVADLQYGTQVWFSSGSRETILDAAGDASRLAVEGLGDREPIGLMAFDCVSRKHVLGPEGVEQEMLRITDATPGTPMSGFYTFGEIARTKGVNGYHNQTLVVLAMS